MRRDGDLTTLAPPFFKQFLTGGPGTGKTHTLRAVLLLARAKRLRPLLAAPTGRAAKRMQEATGLDAGTLHRTLELRPGGRAGRGPDNPLDADLVVVDEVSMLDALLANQLAKAVGAGCHLLLVGDPDQLPSVGAGYCMSELPSSACAANRPGWSSRRRARAAAPSRCPRSSWRSSARIMTGNAWSV